MRRRLALGLLAGVVLAFPGAAAAQRVTITVTSETTVQKVKDTPPLKQTNPGDAVEYKDLLLNVGAQFGKKAGEPVAYDEGIITYQGKSKPQTIYGVATFPGIGKLIYRGPMVDAGHGNTTVAVTGGTGGFKGAHGTLTLGPGTERALNTYEVVIPHGDVNVKGAGGGVA
jgi:hypothetical protein